MKFKLVELKKNTPYVLYIEFPQGTGKLERGEVSANILNRFKQLGINNILVIPYSCDSILPVIKRCSWKKFKRSKRRNERNRNERN